MSQSKKIPLQIIAIILLIVVTSISVISWFNSVDVIGQNEGLETQITEVQSTNDQLQLQIDQLTQANEGLETQITDTLTVTNQLQFKIVQVQSTNDQLQLQIDQLNQDNENLETQIAEVQSTNDQLQLQIDQLQLQIDQLQLQIDQLQLQIEELNTRMIVTITAEDGYQYSLGISGTILPTPSIPQYIGSGSAPSGFLQEGYLTVALSSDQIATSAAVFTESIGYGTYEWRGKFEGTESGGFMGWGFHKYYRQSSDGIEVYFDPLYDGWFLWNAKNNIVTYTEIIGVDFTIEHKFTLEWTNTYIKLYIDDALVAQNEENIPNIRLYPFQEITFRQVNSPQDVYVFSKDWRKIE